MAISYFIPEVWSAGMLGILDKALVYGGVCNRNYEGEISAFGDTVHIASVADVNLLSYTKDTDLTAAQALTDSEQLLVIDQAKAFNFQVDDLDQAQVRNAGALMDEATRRAGFVLRDAADQFLANAMALGAGNALGVVDATTATNVYDLLLVPAAQKLDEANVPEEMRWIVVDPATYAKLRLDARFVNANQSGTAALHNGVVGEAAGFRIYKSNNAKQANREIASVTTASGAKTLTAATQVFTQGDVGLSVTGTGVGTSAKIVSVSADGKVATVDVNSTASAAVTITLAGGGKVAIAGSDIATTFAQQILKVEAYRPELRFGDALKGLYVYGGKVIRSTALVTASVKVA